MTSRRFRHGGAVHGFVQEELLAPKIDLDRYLTKVNNIRVAKRAKIAQVHSAIADLQRLTELFHKRRKQLAAGVGLTEHQWSVLEEISTEHFMPSMFARQRKSSPAAVSKTIRQLIDKRLVAVSLNSADGRQRDYVLTSKGKRVMQLLRENREQAIRQVWLNMPLSRIQAFRQIATELNEKLALLVNGQ